MSEADKPIRVFSRPRAKSLEAYREFIENTFRTLTGQEPPEESPEVWEESWREFWEGADSAPEEDG